MSKFKEGTHIHVDGYPRISAGPQRHKFVHVLIAEGIIGRNLKSDEHVHHIDGNTKNPKWTNLLVVGKAIHDAVSNKQYWYLKQKYSKERAAWWAYFDVTGNTPEEAWETQKTQKLEETNFDVTVM